MRAIGRTGWIQIDSPDPERLAPYISFQRVPEPKVGKNRVYLDLVVDDVELATSRIESPGGRRRGPEGNEFCLIYGNVSVG